MAAAGAPEHVNQALSAKQFRRKFLILILLSWNLPAVIGLSFIVFTGVISASQMWGILTTPTEPAYIIGWVVFSYWYFGRLVRPIEQCIDPDACTAENIQKAIKVLRVFPLQFWGIFVLYLVLAPASVIWSAEYFTDYVAQPIDWFRIELIALIVSIIVGLPIFFLIYDLFGCAFTGVELSRSYVSLKSKVFMIGALVPLLIDTMLVQYFWTRTGYFSMETFVVWLALEILAIIGSLIFVHSIGQSLRPMQRLLTEGELANPQTVAVTNPLSTDELGLLTSGYVRLIQNLQFQNEILQLNNRLVHERDSEGAMAQLMVNMLDLCCRQAQGQQAFLIAYDEEQNDLAGIAQTGDGYKAEGFYRISLDEPSMAAWVFREGKTLVIEDCDSDSRVSPGLRERFDVRSALAVPLMVQGQPIGVLLIGTNQRFHSFSANRIALVELVVQETVLSIHSSRVRAKQKLMEQELYESQERFRQLVESSSSIPWELDLETWRFTYVGPQALEMLGYPIEDWYQEDFWTDHIYEADKGQAVNFCVSSAERGEDHEFEYRMVAADGRLVWIRDSVAVLSEQGKPVKLQGFMFDITRQKESEIARIESEEKFSRVFHSSPVAMLISSFQEGRVIEVNEAFENMFGYRQADIVGKTTQKLKLWSSHEERSVVVGEVQDQGVVENEIRSLVTSLGETIQCQFAVHPLELDGERCLITVLQDVTEQMRVEDTIKSLAKSSSVLAYDKFLREIVGSLAYVYQAQFAFIGQLLPNKHQVQTLMVWAGGQIVDNFVYDLQGTPCQDILNKDKELIPCDAWRLYPDDVMLKDMGVESYFGAPLQSSDGELMGLVSVMDVKPMELEKWVEPILSLFASRLSAEMERHITYEELEIHRNHLEDLVKQRTVEMENLNKELEAFSYSVSHDLRAPLRAIGGFSQALEEDYRDRLDEDARNYLDRIRNGANRMSELIDDMLDLSRVTRTTLKKEKIDLSTMAEQVIDDLRSHDKTGRQVNVDIEPAMQLDADERMLRIVMENLLGNAWKYTSKLNQANIEIGWKTRGVGKVFYVKDNGVGFDPAYANKLFGAFQRLHHSKDFEGSGIGLATVQRILHKHGGSIWAESEPDKGATFYFELP